VDYGPLDIVWIKSDGQVDRRFIRTGRTVHGNLVEVISGLNEGEQLLPPRADPGVTD
jgi:hypothetical protein